MTGRRGRGDTRPRLSVCSAAMACPGPPSLGAAGAALSLAPRGRAHCPAPPGTTRRADDGVEMGVTGREGEGRRRGGCGYAESVRPPKARATPLLLLLLLTTLFSTSSPAPSSSSFTTTSSSSATSSSDTSSSACTYSAPSASATSTSTTSTSTTSYSLLLLVYYF